MRAPSLRRISPPSPFLAAFCGVLLGLLTFAVSAWLWRSGATHVASTTAAAALLVALTCVAAFALLDSPARLRRARVPINRALPHAWWPRETDNVPLLAACLGVPLVVGAGAAVLLFR
jgi:hypothetical protein